MYKSISFIVYDNIKTFSLVWHSFCASLCFVIGTVIMQSYSWTSLFVGVFLGSAILSILDFKFCDKQNEEVFKSVKKELIDNICILFISLPFVYIVPAMVAIFIES